MRGMEIARQLSALHPSETKGGVAFRTESFQTDGETDCFEEGARVGVKKHQSTRGKSLYCRVLSYKVLWTR